MILAYFRSLAARFFHRSQTENDLEEELRSHIQLRADDLERFGLGRAEAERRARIEFGGERKSGFASHLVRQGRTFSGWFCVKDWASPLWVLQLDLFAH